jgi:hypothetical protein
LLIAKQLIPAIVFDSQKYLARMMLADLRSRRRRLTL